MKKKIAIAMIASLLVLFVLVIVSAKPEQVPAAVDPGKPGKTVFVDISVIGRKDRAAGKMTEMHEKMAKEGLTIIGVAPYEENGDLQGFFLTYVKK